MPFLAAREGGEAALLRHARPELCRSRPSCCTKARATPSPRPRSAATASSSAMPRSRSGWSSFPNPEFRASMEKMAAILEFPMGALAAWLMPPREAWITGIGIVSCLGEGADAHWQALTERRAQRRRRDLRALPRPSARADRSRQADPEEGRPAPDGSRGSGSAPMPPGSRSTDAGRQGQCRAARAHGHDRRRRRRRARHRGRRHDPHRHAQGRRTRTPFSTNG